MRPGHKSAAVNIQNRRRRKAEQFNRAAQRDMVLMHQRQGKSQQSVNARGTGRCRAKWLGFGIAVNRHMV